MKNVVLIAMLLLLLAGAYVLKKKSSQVTALQSAVTAKEESLSDLQKNLSTLDAKDKADKAALEAERSKEAQLGAHVSEELINAQKELEAERARLQDLRARRAALSSEKPDQTSLSGPIQNDQQRIAELERQLRDLDKSAKDQASSYKADENSYRSMIKAQQKAFVDQIKSFQSQLKALEKQQAVVKKNKRFFDRDSQSDAIQRQINTARMQIVTIQTQVGELQTKEMSDLAVNQNQQGHRKDYTADQRSNMLAEREKVAADLANLKSRKDLSKRDSGDVTNQMKALQAQENISQVKIESLVQTVNRLKSQVPK